MKPIHTDEKTSKRMSRVRRESTQPEMNVRQALWKLGYKYRITNRDLPGSPDIANRKQKWAVFVHGCFWHRHKGCKKSTTPNRNKEYWESKFRKNIRRDRQAVRELERLGFRVQVIWECETKIGPDRLEVLLSKSMSKTHSS